MKNPKWKNRRDTSPHGARMCSSKFQSCAPTGRHPRCVSLFAARLADTGRVPVPLMREAVGMVNDANAQLMWASPRELLNVFQADEIGCHVITATTDILKKLPLVGKDLHE